MINNDSNNFLDNFAGFSVTALIRFFMTNCHNTNEFPEQQDNLLRISKELGETSCNQEQHNNQALTKLGILATNPKNFPYLIDVLFTLSLTNSQVSNNFIETVRNIPLYPNQDYTLGNALFQEGIIRDNWSTMPNRGKLFLLTLLPQEFKVGIADILEKQNLLSFSIRNRLMKNYELTSALHNLEIDNEIEPVFQVFEAAINIVFERNQLNTNIKQVNIDNLNERSRSHKI